MTLIRPRGNSTSVTRRAAEGLPNLSKDPTQRRSIVKATLSIFGEVPPLSVLKMKR